MNTPVSEIIRGYENKARFIPKAALTAKTGVAVTAAKLAVYIFSLILMAARQPVFMRADRIG